MTGRRILVVDDEPSTRRLLEAALGTWGYEVRTLTNGLDAVDQVAAIEPDLILLDWRMPGMGGARAIPLLRALCRAPIVVVSAFAMPEHRAEIEAGGCDAFLTKPFDFDLLESTLQRLLGR